MHLWLSNKITSLYRLGYITSSVAAYSAIYARMPIKTPHTDPSALYSFNKKIIPNIKFPEWFTLWTILRCGNVH